MNYIKISLGGQERGLKFNQLAFEEFIRLIPADDKNKFDWIYSNSFSAYACVYAGLLGNAIVKREVVDFTFEEVCEWVDEADNEDIKKTWAAFTEMQQYKTLLSKFTEQIRSMQIQSETTNSQKKRAVQRKKK